MPARRFRVAPFAAPPTPGTEVALPLDAARKARTVLRLHPGDEVELFDGLGGEWRVRLVHVGKDHVNGVVTGAHASHASVSRAVDAYVCLLKGDRFDWMLEKATELGIRRIVPVLSSRTVVRVEPGTPDALKRRSRWQAAVRQACAQSGRSQEPEVGDIVAYPTALRDAEGVRIVLDPTATRRIGSVLDDSPDAAPVSLLSGPEGGLSPDEVEKATRSGWIAAALGPHVLRGETAPLAALAVVLHRSGDLG